jgi:alanine racemase
MQLRQSGIGAPVLLLGNLDNELLPECVQNDITINIFNLEKAVELSKAAVKLKRTAKIHIKIDTGMSRLGITAKNRIYEAVDDIMEIAALDNIDIEGLFTHFAASDDNAEEMFTKSQFELFRQICLILEEKGLNVPLKHCANSGAVIKYPYTYLDMVRPGLILYGISPDSEADAFGIQPVMQLKSRIAQIREIGRGIP